VTYDLERERSEILRYLHSMSPAERHEFVGDLRLERAIDEAAASVDLGERKAAGVTYLDVGIPETCVECGHEEREHNGPDGGCSVCMCDTFVTWVDE